MQLQRREGPDRGLRAVGRAGEPTPPVGHVPVRVARLEPGEENVPGQAPRRGGEREGVEEGVPPKDRPVVGSRRALPRPVPGCAVPRLRKDPAAAGRRVQASGFRLEEDGPHQVVRDGLYKSFRSPRRTRTAAVPVGARVVDPAIQPGEKALGPGQGGGGSRRRSPRLPGDDGGGAFPRPGPEGGSDLHASERRAPAIGSFLPPCLPPPRIVAQQLHPARRPRHRPQRHGVSAARPLQSERALPGAGCGRGLGGEVELHSRVTSVRRVGTDVGDHPVPVLQLAALAAGSGEDEAEADAVVGSGREHEAGPAAHLKSPDAHHGGPGRVLSWAVFMPCQSTVGRPDGRRGRRAEDETDQAGAEPSVAADRREPRNNPSPSV